MLQLLKLPFLPDHYRDQPIRIIGSFVIAHFIEMLGRSESSLSLLLQKQYYLNIGSGFLMAFITWQLIARITSYLDQKFDWHYYTTHRLLWQILLGVLLPSLIVFFLACLQFRFIIRFDIFATDWLLYEYPVCVAFLIFLNGYYVGYYFYKQWLISEQKYNGLHSPDSLVNNPTPSSPTVDVSIPKDSKPQLLIANRGHKNIPIPVADIAYSYIISQNCYLKTFNDEEFLIHQSLDELVASLPADVFFRANRQLLVHVKACAAFSPIENGKLTLHLQPTTNLPAIVSQKRAKSFKEWLAKR